MTDYSKDRVHHINYSEALEKAKAGWVIAREGWNGKNMIVFLAREGTFVAADLITGELEPFLVMKTAQGTYVPWLCSQSDAMADDWAAITRQTFQRQVSEREWPSDPRIAPKEYRSGMATSDSDFDAD